MSLVQNAVQILLRRSLVLKHHKQQFAQITHICDPNLNDEHEDDYKNLFSVETHMA